MTFQITPRGSVSRRTLLAAMPVGLLAAGAARPALAQPAAAEPVSFYLGQVLALASLQAQAIGRLRPLLANPAVGDAAWQSGASAEAGVVGAVASVLGVMEPPPELTASVGELRLASAAYRGAADAARNAAGGDAAALDAARGGLAQGAAHILLWLDALTAETANDWGDGLRTLTDAAAPAPVAEAAPEPAVAPPVEPAPEAPPAEEEPANRQARNRENRQNGQQQPEQPNRQNLAKKDKAAAAE